MNAGSPAGRPANLSSIIKVMDIAMTKINGHCLICLYSMDAECIGVGVIEMQLILEWEVN